MSSVGVIIASIKAQLNHRRQILKDGEYGIVCDADSGSGVENALAGMEEEQGESSTNKRKAPLGTSISSRSKGLLWNILIILVLENSLADQIY